MDIEKTISLFSIAGLIIDIIGVVMVFLWGLPIQLPERDLYVKETITEEQEEKNKIQKIKAYAGLGFILAGFFLQLISYLINYFNIK
jgi:hypothetical protein